LIYSEGNKFNRVINRYQKKLIIFDFPEVLNNMIKRISMLKLFVDNRIYDIENRGNYKRYYILKKGGNYNEK